VTTSVARRNRLRPKAIDEDKAACGSRVVITTDRDAKCMLARFSELGAKDAHTPDIVGAVGVDNLRRASVDPDLGLAAIVAELGKPKDALALEVEIDGRSLVRTIFASTPSPPEDRPRGAGNGS
jgi:hypothetical protein